jgi:predicted acylesterase/phospholipase RssA
MDSKTIGLCLSGGGHRASVFSLGALLYLADAGRRGDIRTISSVSGGSLTSGSLAAQKNPLGKMTRTEFEHWAAAWARQIAGSPKWWRRALIGQALLLVIWALLVCLGLTPLTRFSTFTLAWWETQVIYVAAVCVWACTAGFWSGGTLWG